MSAINEAYVIKQYKNNHSTYSIAKELGTYPKKIEKSMNFAIIRMISQQTI